MLVYQYGLYNKECIVKYSNRKNLSINVNHKMDIILCAPYNYSIDKMQKAILDKRIWIKKQLKFFEKYHPYITTRKYVSGETHMYLGRQYRLKITSDYCKDVKLKGGYFYMMANDPEQAKKKMDAWYKEKSKYKLINRLEHCVNKVPFAKMPIINIRKMEKRWGSLSENGVMTLNRDLIKAPVDCIDYVILHELCHQKHMNHSKSFWNLLQEVCPDWEKTKHKLEMLMS
ncbi:MAG: SprT family zinc-dependent metalloprotease [Alphaproteobacteria bacterium]|nr:SprT family zinc-dependent metalloprotease [Alphaproteobacteria bacterium]